MSERSVRSWARGINPVAVVQVLLLVIAAAWFVFGGLTLVGVANGTTDQAYTGFAIAMIMFGNMGALSVATNGIGKRQRRYFVFTIILLIVNVVVSLTRDFGVFGTVTEVAGVVALGILVVEWKWFW